MMQPWRLPSTPKPRVPAGERFYAIGDVHGELGLLAGLLCAIADDAAARGPCRTTIILLGDVIDRGTGAAALLKGLAQEQHPRLVILRGNHETAMAAAWHGDEEAAHFWLAFGGAATLTGFGIPQAVIAAGDPAQVIAAMRKRIDRRLIDWLDALPLSWSAGDYFFVHAGIRPGVPLAEQEEEDLLWIRDGFLDSRRQHPQVIVHGHTIEPGPVRLRHNRIGLDTGAHEHGVLSALGLEGEERWTIQARWPGEAAEGASGKRPGYADVRSLLAAILDQPDGEPMPLSPGCTVSIVADKGLEPRAGLLAAGGMVPVAAALGLAVVGGALASGVLQRKPAPPPPLAQTAEAIGHRPPLVDQEAMTAPVPVPARMESPHPAAPVLAALAAPAPPLPSAPATGRQRPALARNDAPPALPRGGRNGANPVDPYAGRVAQPLAGAAQQEAVLADRLATRELNLQQAERAGAGTLGPAVDDAVLAATQARDPDADATAGAERTWRRRAGGSLNARPRPRVQSQD